MNSEPTPIPTDEVATADLVMQDIELRKCFGIKKYGTPLQPNNGRDNLQDLYEELLDACMYIKNEIERRKSGDRRRNDFRVGPTDG